MYPAKHDISLGYVTISLHPILLRNEPAVITAENRHSIAQTPESVTASVLAWGPSIAFVHNNLVTYDLCRKAVEGHSSAICSIKPHLLPPDQYYDICLLAMQKNGRNLQYIPQNQEIADTAIKNACWALAHCADQFKTYDNCMSAVTRNGQLLQHVPAELIDQEMCKAATRTKYVCLEHIPPNFISQELCDFAVKANGENIRHVPDTFMSSDLAMLAINSPDVNMSGSHIQYVPAAYLTKEIIVEAMKRWSPIYKRIPPEALTADVQAAIAPWILSHKT